MGAEKGGGGGGGGQWERKGRERGERGHPGEEKEIETRGRGKHSSNFTTSIPSVSILTSCHTSISQCDLHS